MKEDFEFLRGLANCEDKEQMARYIEEHQPKPMTNADRIRAMNDECLAGQFVQIVKEAVKAMTDVDLPDEMLDIMWSNFLEKLKQPAEGE